MTPPERSPCPRPPASCATPLPPISPRSPPSRRHPTALWLAVTGTPWHEAALADPDQRHLVLTDADHVVGFATLAGARRTDHRVELRRMVLHPGLRSRGNGRVLLEAVGRYAGTALGARTLWLDVKAENVRARGLYAAAGFTPYEDPPVRPDPGLVYLARPAN